MIKSGFIIRPMQLTDIVYGLRLSNEEGWNQTEKDWKLLIEGPENTCIVAQYGKKIVGTTTAINYSNKIAWIGMVLVDREYRGQGVSKSLLREILEKLQSCVSIKLDATSQGQRVYTKFDFKDEYSITRMTTAAKEPWRYAGGETIVAGPAGKEDIKEIIDLDEQVFGANRTALIESLVKEYPQKTSLLKRDDHLSGFALGRTGNKYHHIGPVEALCTSDAKILITNELNKLDAQPVVIDVLSDKEELVGWLNSIGFSTQRQFVRMYKTTNPFPGDSNKQYLICGPEFG